MAVASQVLRRSDLLKLLRHRAPVALCVLSFSALCTAALLRFGVCHSCATGTRWPHPIQDRILPTLGVIASCVCFATALLALVARNSPVGQISAKANGFACVSTFFAGILLFVAAKTVGIVPCPICGLYWAQQAILGIASIVVLQPRLRIFTFLLGSTLLLSGAFTLTVPWVGGRLSSFLPEPLHSRLPAAGTVLTAPLTKVSSRVVILATYCRPCNLRALSECCAKLRTTGTAFGLAYPADRPEYRRLFPGAAEYVEVTTDTFLSLGLEPQGPPALLVLRESRVDRAFEISEVPYEDLK